MVLKTNIDEILKEIKIRPFLLEEEQIKLVDYLDKNKINEGDAAKLVRLNNAAFSVRKKNFTVPRLLKILIEIINQNAEFKVKIGKINDSLK